MAFYTGEIRASCRKSVVADTVAIETGNSHHRGSAYNVRVIGAGQCNKLQPLRETGADRNGEAEIPAFDGKESWSIWINRFEAIADLRGWNEEKRLDMLLPKLQSQVGEYAFGVLPRRFLNSYKELVGELNSIFGTVEIPRVYASKFHNRVQGEDESIEEYAVALRCLYFKGYKHRDSQTREEDLVQRFLDGLKDQDMRFAVEFHKNPTSLDDAVYHAVEYAELKNRIFTGQHVNSTFRKQEKTTKSSNSDMLDENFDHSYAKENHINENPGAKMLECQSSNTDNLKQEILTEALLQVRDLLHAMDSHCKLGKLEDGHLKQQHTEAPDISLKGNDVVQKDTLPPVTEYQNYVPCRLTEQETQSGSDEASLSKDKDHECIAGVRQFVPDAESGVLDWQSNVDLKAGERPENSNYTEVEMRDLRSIKDQMNETLVQELGEHSREREERIPMDYQLLVPRNKFLPCKGETPPKCIPDRLGRMYAAVSVAA